MFQAFLEERAKASGGFPEGEKARFLGQRLLMNPAFAGVSGTQRYYRTALAVLGVLVCLVLFISCANVANLITAQAAARQREMALRISIGAGRWRLVQLMVVECAWLAFFAACIGGGFAWWAAPWIVEMIGTPDNPARLILPADWRVLGFGVALAFAVTMLFGLAPALRASGVKPAVALKRRSSAPAVSHDAAVDRRAGCLLRSGAFRSRTLSGNLPPPDAPAHGILSRAASHFGNGDAAASSRRLMGAGCRTPPKGAGSGGGSASVSGRY